MKRLLILLLAAMFTVAFFGCSGTQTHGQVAATTLPVYDYTARLCQGTDLQVTRLVTENVSCLHDYTLQVSQMRAIEEAEVIVLSGAGLEDFLSDALDSADKVIDASTGIDLLCYESEHDHGHTHEHEHSHEHDPHIWLSPDNAKSMANNICAELSNAYPQYAPTFAENLQALETELDRLSAYAAEQLAALGCRELMTFHDGFAYMADAFDLTILHAVEEESGSEASAAELIKLSELVMEHELPCIFTEQSGSTAAASVISAETGAKLFSLDMAMAGDSYFDAMYHNIDTLKEALG